MAELPELETLRRELEKEAVGKRFKVPEVTGTKVIRRNGNKKAFQGRLEGAKVKSVDRRGTFLVGQPRQRRAAPDRARARRAPREGGAQDHAPEGDGARAHLHPGRPDPARRPHGSRPGLRGGVRRPGAEVPEVAAGGLDPVADAVSWTSFARVLLSRSAKLKTLLMDPHVVAGIGPIYSDEILWEAGLRYDRTSDSLSSQEIRRLFRALVETLHEAVKHRGTTLDDEPVRRPLRQARRLPGRAEGVRPGGRAVPPLPGSDREVPVRQQAPLLLRGLPGVGRQEGASRAPGRPLTSPGVFLKTLTLKGFKSFADTTALDLEPGVTVVVGPNGSGKSNVVDAIGWVLGAQAPSAVRSQKMDDVIFAGTPSARRSAGPRWRSPSTTPPGCCPIDFTEVTDHPHAVPHRRQRVRDQRRAVPAARHPGAAVRHRRRPPAARDRQPGPDRRGAQRPARGPAPHHRGGRRRPEVPQAQGEGRAPPRRHRGQPHPPRRPAPRGAPPAAPARAAGRRRPPPRRRSSPSSRALRIFLAGRELDHARSAAWPTAGAARPELADRGRRCCAAGSPSSTPRCWRPRPSCGHVGGDDLGDALVRFESLRERARGLVAVLTERRRGIDRERGAFVDQAVIATLEAEAARLSAELAEADAEAERARAAGARSWPWPRRRWPTARAAFEQRLGRRRARRPPAAPPRSAASWPRCGRASSAATPSWPGPRPGCAALRREARPPRGRGRAPARRGRGRRGGRGARWSARLGEAEAAADRRRGRRWPRPRPRCARPTASATRGRPGPRRWPSRSTRPGPEPAPSASPTVDGRRRHPARPRRHRRRLGGRLRGGRRRGPGARSWSTASTPAAPRSASLHAAATTPSAVPCSRSVRSPRRRRRSRRARSASRCAATCAPRDADVDALLDALLGRRRRRRAAAGRRRSTRPWPTPTPSSSPARAAASAPPGWRVGHRLGRRHRRRARGGPRARRGRPPRRPPTPRPSLHGARSLLDEARQAEAALARAARRARRSPHRRHRRPAARRGRPTRRRHRGRGPAAATPTSWPSGSPASGPASAELEAALPAARGRGGRRRRARPGDGRRPRPQLEERAAAVGSLRTDLEVRTAGLAERRQFLRRRLAEVEARLEGSVEARREAEVRRVELDAKQPARRPARRARRRAPRGRSRPSLADAARAAPAPERGRSGRPPPGSTACAASAVDAERRLEETREQARRAEIDEAEVTLRLETAVEALRRDLDAEPDVAMAAEAPAADRGRHAHGPGPRARARAAAHGPDQPAGPRGVRGAAGAPRRSSQEQLDDVKSSRRDLAKVIRAIDGEIVDVFAGGLRRRVAELRAALPDAVPRRPGPAPAHRARRPARRPASRSRPSRRARTSGSCRCCPVASGRSPRWRSCSPCSAAGRRPST